MIICKCGGILMSNIYENIRTRREQLGMSQEDLARKMGYKSRSSINKIESGENDIPQSKIEAFAKALNTTPAYLMGWEDASKANIEENKTNTIKFIGRDGTVEVKHFSDEEYAIVKKMLSALPDLDEDL